MTKMILNWLRKKSRQSKILEKQIQYAALYGVLACHGFVGGFLLMWRVGIKVLEQQGIERKGKHGKA